MDALLLILPMVALWLVIWIAYTIVRKMAKKFVSEPAREKYQHRLEESQKHALRGYWLYWQYIKDAKGAVAKRRNNG